VLVAGIRGEETALDQLSVAAPRRAATIPRRCRRMGQANPGGMVETPGNVRRAIVGNGIDWCCKSLVCPTAKTTAPLMGFSGKVEAAGLWNCLA
jgi:hypothetical protein